MGSEETQLTIMNALGRIEAKTESVDQKTEKLDRDVTLFANSTRNKLEAQDKRIDDVERKAYERIATVSQRVEGQGVKVAIFWTFLTALVAGGAGVLWKLVG